ncbi:hypothetical protein BS78_07G169100 [Paspalum vaginatum]|nr:hypothetical protein BS78_07G169100 [Paspalum vaginatum]
MEAGEDARGKKGAPGGGGMEWELERQYEDLEREMVLMAAGAERKQPKRSRPLAADLLQNCDLPPPAKLYGPLPTLQRLESAAAGADQKGGGNDSLLRALRLSQSRAREAEAKLAAAGAANGGLAALLVRDSVALSAHRRWVMMLEAENSRLQGGGAGAEPDTDTDDGSGGAAAPRGGAGVAAWWVALALCVGVAGVGLALGRFLC